VEHAAWRLGGDRFADPVAAVATLEPLLPEVREVAGSAALRYGHFHDHVRGSGRLAHEARIANEPGKAMLTCGYR